jgi:uncharacterized delta-60 repeat protein
MRTLFCVLTLAALIACGVSSAGSTGAAYSVLLQPNGKIVVAGWRQRGGQDTFGLARYTSGGALDKSFGLRGKVAAPFGTRSGAYSAALQADGKIITAGFTGRVYSSSYRFGLARYTSKGALDQSFGTKGHATAKIGSAGSFANAVAVQPDGKVIAAVGTVLGDEIVLVRYRPNGTPDTSFGSGGRVRTSPGPGAAEALTLQPDGKIVVAGAIREDVLVARYNADGSRDSTLGVNGIVLTSFGGAAAARAVALQEDGKIVIAGLAGTGDPSDPGFKFALARYNGDGSLDTSFGSGGIVTTTIGNIIAADLPYGGVANAMAIQPDGKIVAGGAQFVPWPGRGNFAIVRYLSDGSLDPSFGDGGKVTTSFGYAPPENPTEDGDVVNALALQPDGKILAAGESQFGPHTEQYAVALARYLSDGSLDPAFGQGGEVKTSLALCQVPRLRGQKMDWFAQKRIKGAHCAVGKITRVHNRRKRRRIISERPRPGTVHVEGAKVRVLVSLGRRR